MFFVVAFLLNKLLTVPTLIFTSTFKLMLGQLKFHQFEGTLFSY